MENLAQELGSITGTISGPLLFDVLAHTISFTTRYTVDGEEFHQSVVFSGVAAYYFQANRGEERRTLFPPEEGDVMVVEEVLYYPRKGLGRIGFLETETEWANSWTPMIRCSINFLVDMFNNCSLFIEADCITIDGKQIYVGYPSENGELN